MKRTLLQILLIFSLLTIYGGRVYSQHQQEHLHTSKHPTNKFHQHHLMYINNIRLTGMLGLSSYYGDLCDQFICFRYRPSITAGAYWRYDQRISVRADLTYLRIAGTDVGGLNATRNLSFRSPCGEFAAGIMYDLIRFDRNYHLRAKFTPYLFIEAGLLYYNPRAKYNGKWYSLRPLQTEGRKYSSLTVSIPFGGGLRYIINDDMDLSFEVAYRKTFTDYLDDVSTVYKDNASFTNPTAAALADRSREGGYNAGPNGLNWEAGHKRGNPNKKDGYFVFGFKLEIMLKTTAQIHTINNMPRFRQRMPGMHRKYR